MNHRRRLALLAGGAVLSLAPAAASAAAHGVKPSQQLAVLTDAHLAYSSPARSVARPVRVRPFRPLTGERTVLPVLGDATSDGVVWLHVRLPGRPNGHTGWIRARGTRAATTRWHVVVERAQRRVLLYRSGRLVRTFTAIVGKPATPTPRGEFFVEEAIELRPGDVGAPYALALSARSTVLQEFDGGPGQIALHGLANVGGRLGTAVSHGCMRLAGAAMRYLVERVGPGVPVTIRR